MTTITLQLEPAAAKFFSYHHDNVDKPSKLQKQFRQIVMMLCEVHDTGIIKSTPGTVTFSTLISVRTTKFGHDARKALFIPEPKMKLLNETLISLLEEEINNTVALYEAHGKMMKEAFQFIMNKYDLDSEDYSYDRMKKMNYRFRTEGVKM
jgi:hypothetical protein